MVTVKEYQELQRKAKEAESNKWKDIPDLEIWLGELPEDDYRTIKTMFEYVKKGKGSVHSIMGTRLLSERYGVEECIINSYLYHMSREMRRYWDDMFSEDLTNSQRALRRKRRERRESLQGMLEWFESLMKGHNKKGTIPNLSGKELKKQKVTTKNKVVEDTIANGSSGYSIRCYKQHNGNGNGLSIYLYHGSDYTLLVHWNNGGDWLERGNRTTESILGTVEYTNKFILPKIPVSVRRDFLTHFTKLLAKFTANKDRYGFDVDGANGVTLYLDKRWRVSGEVDVEYLFKERTALKITPEDKEDPRSIDPDKDKPVDWKDADEQVWNEFLVKSDKPTSNSDYSIRFYRINDGLGTDSMSLYLYGTNPRTHLVDWEYGGEWLDKGNISDEKVEEITSYTNEYILPNIPVELRRDFLHHFFKLLDKFVLGKGIGFRYMPERGFKILGIPHLGTLARKVLATDINYLFDDRVPLIEFPEDKEFPSKVSPSYTPSKSDISNKKIAPDFDSYVKKMYENPIAPIKADKKEQKVYAVLVTSAETIKVAIEEDGHVIPYVLEIDASNPKKTCDEITNWAMRNLNREYHRAFFTHCTFAIYKGTDNGYACIMNDRLEFFYGDQSKIGAGDYKKTMLRHAVMCTTEMYRYNNLPTCQLLPE